jgi:hypothetical protein
MVGVITNWDILTHPFVTIRAFGWQVFFRAVFAGSEKTFLSLLHGAHATSTNVPPLLERCIGLELRAKRVYRALAKAFDDDASVGPFFDGLAVQEQYHADLLGVCRAAALRGGWKATLFNPWQDYLPRLERQMEAAEAAVSEIDSVDAALQLVVQVECSEINQVFDAALAASDSVFVNRLRPFREAMESHMNHIVERLSELSPKLALACRELRARFPRVS